MRETSPNSGGTYRPGDNRAVCDECGLVYLRSEMLIRWDKALVCRKDWEPRHPQDFVRGKADKIAVKNARPDYFAATLYDDAEDSTGWTVGSGWTQNIDKFDHATGSVALDRAITGLSVGTQYLVQSDIVRDGGTLAISLVTATGESGDISVTESKEARVFFTATATTDTLRFTPSSFTGSVGVVSIWEYPTSITQANL